MIPIDTSALSDVDSFSKNVSPLGCFRIINSWKIHRFYGGWCRYFRSLLSLLLSFFFLLSSPLVSILRRYFYALISMLWARLLNKPVTRKKWAIIRHWFYIIKKYCVCASGSRNFSSLLLCYGCLFNLILLRNYFLIGKKNGWHWCVSIFFFAKICIQQNNRSEPHFQTHPAIGSRPCYGSFEFYSFTFSSLSYWFLFYFACF